MAGESSRGVWAPDARPRVSTWVRAETLPYIPLRLAAWRGQASTALDLVEVMIRGARTRGEGCAITAAEYATAVLYNGLGQYELALDAAEKAAAADEIATSSWALYELVEAASRCGRRGVARDAADRLSERARRERHRVGEGNRGALARARARQASGPRSSHREAIDWLGRCRMAAHLARARLTYGEWLRRENRRVDARQQLRRRYDMFASMGADGFAERARRELLATGEKVRKRRDDTRDELTPQEEHIARLARDGRTNPEIGAELFISARTVEWHLRKVFTKLGISSRKGLHDVLPGRDRRRPASLHSVADRAGEGRGQAPRSSDETGLMDHARGLASGDADEDALVRPVEMAGGGRDLG